MLWQSSGARLGFFCCSSSLASQFTASSLRSRPESFSSEKEITNEDLAEMIQVNIVEKMATKEQVEKLRTEVREIRDVMLADHQHRIERLEQAFQAAHPHS